MSAHRDLMNAQTALNEAVGAWRATFKASPDTYAEPFKSALAAYDEWDRLRNEFDGAGPAAPRPTSIISGKSRPHLKGSMRREIMQTFVSTYRLGDGAGMTCDQVEARLRKAHQTVSPAINALATGGWIKDSGTRRMTRLGDHAIVWIPTEHAIEIYTRLAVGGD